MAYISLCLHSDMLAFVEVTQCIAKFIRSFPGHWAGWGLHCSTRWRYHYISRSDTGSLGMLICLCGPINLPYRWNRLNRRLKRCRREEYCESPQFLEVDVILKSFHVRMLYQSCMPGTLVYLLLYPSCTVRCWGEMLLVFLGPWVALVMFRHWKYLSESYM